jgi:hypothetical protein
MNSKSNFTTNSWTNLNLVLAALALALTVPARAETPPAAIPFPDIGARATANYQGKALGIMATSDGARLRCGFQKLEGHATTEGLWLESTGPDAAGKLRLVATTLSRVGRSTAGSQLSTTLPATGTVSVQDKLVRFTRPSLTEEYFVSVDGVQQDFVIAARPAGAGDLRVELALSGARAEAAADGARLRLEGSGRVLAYSRLRVADATGRELTARLEVLSADRLAVSVADASATYPVRIDPTFSDADWVSLISGVPGANASVRAIAVDSSGNLYVGGAFTLIGTAMKANCIAKWDGSTWSALGGGLTDNPNTSPSVNALTMVGTNLYAAGRFTLAGGQPAASVAKWDGRAWSALGSGIPWSDFYNYQAYVTALAVSGDNLYVGGCFTNAGGVAVTNIAQWNGRAWSALGSGINGIVYALAVSGTNLYAGGWFTTAGGVPTNCIAKWDGRAWSALGSGMNGYCVNALLVSGSILYAGGSFTTAGGAMATNIAKWDGSAWSALGSGITGDNPYVNALAASGTDLYAGGIFTSAGGVTVNFIAKWDGSAWSALGSGMGSILGNAGVGALAVRGTNLYAGGFFTSAGDVPADSIAKWDGNAWSALNSWMNGCVAALAVSGTNLYAGGNFTTAGGVTANYISKWDGSAWSPLGLGLNSSSVYALAVSGTSLYAGGGFTMAGTVAANNIAKWDGSAWSALGSGTGGTNGDASYVLALAVSGTNLYAGGWFTTAGGVAATNIAKWDGGAWSALGSGLNGDVYALAVSGTSLYIGGGFTMAGGVAANCIAKWDGSAWSALGSGINGPFGLNGAVAALAVSGTNLYAAGYFTNMYGLAWVAKWDGSAWSALGWGMGPSAQAPTGYPTGPHPYVSALAVSGTNLYAGGRFTTADWGAANYIAKWDGSAWSALGSGTDGIVSAMAADGAGHLFVAANFAVDGANACCYIAQANVSGTGGQLHKPAYSPATGFTWTFSDATAGQPYRIQTTASLASGSWTDFTNFTYAGPIVITDTTAVGHTNRFYRAVTP